MMYEENSNDVTLVSKICKFTTQCQIIINSLVGKKMIMWRYLKERMIYK